MDDMLWLMTHDHTDHNSIKRKCWQLWWWLEIIAAVNISFLYFCVQPDDCYCH